MAPISNIMKRETPRQMVEGKVRSGEKTRRRQRDRERENISVQGKTLIIGDSPTKGRGDLIALFLHFFCIFKSFQNKN